MTIRRRDGSPRFMVAVIAAITAVAAPVGRAHAYIIEASVKYFSTVCNTAGCSGTYLDWLTATGPTTVTQSGTTYVTVPAWPSWGYGSGSVDLTGGKLRAAAMSDGLYGDGQASAGLLVPLTIFNPCGLTPIVGCVAPGGNVTVTLYLHGTYSVATSRMTASKGTSVSRTTSACLGTFRTARSQIIIAPSG